MRLLRKAAVALAWVAGSVLVLALLAGVLLPRAFGHEVFAVTSGSMEPLMSRGDLVVVEPVATDELEPGDVITFHGNGTGDLSTHRIIRWVGMGADRHFETKGDANAVADPVPVPAAAVVGRATYVAPRLGYLVDAARTPIGAGAAAALVAFAVLGGSGRDRTDQPRGRRSAARDEEVRDEPARV